MSRQAASTSSLDALRHVEHEVAVLLRRTRRALAERARLVHPDLQAVGYLVLVQIDADGPVRGSGLCEALHLDKGAVSRSVQHLIELGLVDRTPDPDDGRATLLSVSAEGRRRARAVDEARRGMLEQRFADWSREELHEVAETLHRYNATVEPEQRTG
jgi:DNA-binding MarR family transcriptional regulator